MSSGSPLDDVLASIESAIHLRKRDLGGLLAPIEAALAAYRLAVESDAAREYCASHSLPAPRGSVLSRSLAAEHLAQAVAGLPELAQRDSTQSAPAPSEPQGAAETTAWAPLTGIAAALPNLVRSVKNGRIVVIGAFAGRVRTLPEPLGSATDFIDTARDGVHAVGNLPQRLRQGRIVGVVICDLAISHQHAEPVVHAARAAHVPVGFAGKGGNAALARALESLDAQLAG